MPIRRRDFLLGLVAAPLAATAARAGDTRQPFDAPEFVRSSTWINSDPLSMAKLRGKIVVVHFWTHGCINCVHNYPAYKAWSRDYAQKDVVLVGVHTPELENERDPGVIRAKAKANGLTFPIAVDNDRANWDAWGNSVWPTVYIADKRGKVRFRWQGELNWKGAKGQAEAARTIDAMLRQDA